MSFELDDYLEFHFRGKKYFGSNPCHMGLFVVDENDNEVTMKSVLDFFYSLLINLKRNNYETEENI